MLLSIVPSYVFYDSPSRMRCRDLVILFFKKNLRLVFRFGEFMGYEWVWGVYRFCKREPMFGFRLIDLVLVWCGE